MSTAEIIVAILGMAVVTLGCRCFFLWPDRKPPLPGWLVEGMRFAPMAALIAVVTPEIVMTQGHLIDTWRDPRIFGALAGLGWYRFRRGLLGTIVVGTCVMLAMRWFWLVGFAAA